MTEKQKNQARQFAAFITEVAEAMKKHKVDDMLCIFGLNGEIRNTYIPLAGEEKPMYCNLSDGIHSYLQAGGFKRSEGKKHSGTLKLSADNSQNQTPNQ